MRVWLIKYLEEPIPDVAATREMAYELARDYVESMCPTNVLAALEDSYYKSYDEDFGVIGYLNVISVPVYA